MNIVSVRQKKRYTQKFRQEWLEEDFCKDWIQECPTDPTLAICKYCKVAFVAKKFGIKNHFQSKKHIDSSIQYINGDVREINTGCDVPWMGFVGKDSENEYQSPLPVASTSMQHESYQNKFGKKFEGKKCKIYPQRFRKQWLQEEFCKDWIEEFAEDPTLVWCKFCKLTFVAKMFSIKHHSQSNKHLEASPGYEEILSHIDVAGEAEHVDEDELKVDRKRENVLNDYLHPKQKFSKKKKCHKTEEISNGSTLSPENDRESLMYSDDREIIGTEIRETSAAYQVECVINDDEDEEPNSLYNSTSKQEESEDCDVKNPSSLDREMVNAMEEPKNDDNDGDEFFLNRLGSMMQELSLAQKLSFRTDVQKILIEYLKQ